MKLLKYIKAYFAKRKKEKEFKAKLAELRKRDPFNYKNF